MRMNQTMWRVGFVAVSLGVAGLAAPAMAEETKPAEKKPVLSGPKADGEARPRGGFSGERRGDRGEHMRKVMEELNLTDAQKESIRTIMAEHRTQAQAFREANKEKVEGLREQMRAAREAGDREKGQAAGKQLRELMESGPNPAKLAAQIRGVLTPEQQKTFDERTEKAREEMRARMEQRGPRGDGEARPMRDGERPRGERRGEGEGRRGGERREKKLDL